MPALYDSAVDLTAPRRRAAEAHGRHGQEVGRPDPGWPDGDAPYQVGGRSGVSGELGPGAST
jgi:hypothetical protein